MVRSLCSPLSICAPFYGYFIADQSHKEMKELETRSFLRRRSRTNKVLNCLTTVEKGVGILLSLFCALYLLINKNKGYHYNVVG